jgi:methylated-DNA-[protein]-cysteine S-methyltransferase
MTNYELQSSHTIFAAFATTVTSGAVKLFLEMIVLRPFSCHNACMAKNVWMGTLDETPLGDIWVAVNEVGLVAVNLWEDRRRFEQQVEALTGCVPVLDDDRVTAVTTQLDEYLQKQRKVFTVPIDWSVMTPFQQTVLRAVAAVAYGRLQTYNDIAQTIGKPKAVRAVGRANATNPMPIIIPCHRILGSNGKLHGYSAPGGLETKAWLLRLEGSWLL